MGDREVEEVRYRAFLSYSHRDAAAAARLHRRLEAYRVPRRLAGRETPRGPVPARLWPIFRDREELPAATDLSETVREALARSGALIILCSPHAAASLWVAEEIRVFRELHPDRPVLAAILDGDPPDCFPGLLRAFGDGHEPLATDLRRDKDGPRLGVLKLVAGITGLGLDDLVQRDATRRVRRVMAVTAGAVVAMLAMAVLVVVALQARGEAEGQRAEAEGLIRFMHTDLRERLRGVGRIDVLSAANERALAYYDRQGTGELSPGNRAMRALVVQTIGEDSLRRGDVGAAAAKFGEAYRETAALVAAHPDDAQVVFAHGQSEFWIGYVAQLNGNWAAAGRRYARYAAAAEHLIALAPGNPDYMLEMAWGASNRGVVQRDGERNPAVAQASFEIAVRWFERAFRTRPRDSDARDLANAYGDLADSFHVRRMWTEALSARMAAHRILLRLHEADRSNLESTFRLAIAERAVGHEAALTGDRGTAAPFMRRAFDRSGQLTAHDPRNAEWRVLRALIECDYLSRTLSLDPPVPPAALRQDVRATLSSLSNRGDPRRAQFAPCLPQIISEQ
jgi:tetratricopeptide (TPR) repeat protein